MKSQEEEMMAKVTQREPAEGQANPGRGDQGRPDAQVPVHKRPRAVKGSRL